MRERKLLIALIILSLCLLAALIAAGVAGGSALWLWQENASLRQELSQNGIALSSSV